jgi:hypothetical protein
MKIQLLAAVAAVAAVAGMAGPATAAESASTCAGDYVWRVNVAEMNVWESENYNKADWVVHRGEFLRGPSGRRDNGWVPVRHWWNGSGWVYLLEGANDTNDFVRGSGVDFYGCA